MKRHQWTDAELIEVGLRYAHKGDWKRSPDRLDSAAYQAALNRPDVFMRATKHMTPKASPYAGSYVIYAYEFDDRHVYVGLSFTPKARHYQHMQRGPVQEHMRVCATYRYQIVEEGLSSPADAAAAEDKHISAYREAGWHLLNTNKAGGMGTIQKTRWTKEAVLEDAKRFQTKQAWIDGSQGSYRTAKREGWFEEASAHMPKRVLGVGAGVPKSAEAREKMRQAKLGKKHSDAHRQKQSEGIKSAWSDRQSSSVGTGSVAK